MCVGCARTCWGVGRSVQPHIPRRVRDTEEEVQGHKVRRAGVPVSLSSLCPHPEGGGDGQRLGEEGPRPSVLLPGAWTEPLQETTPSIAMF